MKWWIDRIKKLEGELEAAAAREKRNNMQLRVLEYKISQMQPKLDNLMPGFLEAMDDIGRYGFVKYGADSFQARRLKGDVSRYMDRVTKDMIMSHVREHAWAYQRGEIHDNFHTLKHQLAAIAFNAMMEYYFAELCGEGEDVDSEGLV